MGVASGCGEQEVRVASGSGWNLWVWLLGVVVRRYIDFLILLNHAASLLFVNFLTFFFQYFFVITFYVLNNVFTQYKHTYGQLRASHGSRMKAAHSVFNTLGVLRNRGLLLSQRTRSAQEQRIAAESTEEREARL